MYSRLCTMYSKPGRRICLHDDATNVRRTVRRRAISRQRRNIVRTTSRVFGGQLKYHREGDDCPPCRFCRGPWANGQVHNYQYSNDDVERDAPQYTSESIITTSYMYKSALVKPMMQLGFTFAQPRGQFAACTRCDFRVTRFDMWLLFPRTAWLRVEVAPHQDGYNEVETVACTSSTPEPEASCTSCTREEIRDGLRELTTWHEKSRLPGQPECPVMMRTKRSITLDDLKRRFVAPLPRYVFAREVGLL